MNVGGTVTDILLCVVKYCTLYVLKDCNCKVPCAYGKCSILSFAVFQVGLPTTYSEPDRAGMLCRST